jgi:insertion element IS1 protein InsB
MHFRTFFAVLVSSSGLRTRINRVVRKTICFSKTTQMHDIVIGLFVNRYAFGRTV